MRRRYLISGEVQGVGFRYFTLRVAERIGVRGWVRNLPNGSVEVEGEGTAEQLALLEERLRQGPAAASVTNVHWAEVSDEEPSLSSFMVR